MTDQPKRDAPRDHGLDPVAVLNDPFEHRVIDIVTAMRELDQADVAILEAFDETTGHRVGTLIVATRDDAASIAKRAFDIDPS
jgi:hypothetical protein